MDGKKTNWFSYTEHQKKGHIPDELKQKGYVVYYVSSEDEIAFSAPGPVLDVGFGSQRAAFEALKKSCRDLGKTLVVRVHPHLLKKPAVETRFWQGEQSEHVLVYGPGHPVDTYQLAQQAEVVVTYISTVGIEANFLGVPLVVLGRAIYYGLPELMRPKRQEELARCLENPVLPETRLASLMYGFYQNQHGYRFKYFKPESMMKGTFKGLTLFQHQPKQKVVARSEQRCLRL